MKAGFGLHCLTRSIYCILSVNMVYISGLMIFFQVSYLCAETRDSCAKMGRELLSAVVISHPFIVSLLTEKVYEAMEQIGNVSTHLLLLLHFH